MHSTVVLCVVLALSALGCSASKRDNSSTARQGAIASANVGQTKSIIVDPANPRIVFAVTAFVASGLSSTNGGASWREVSPSGAVVTRRWVFRSRRLHLTRSVNPGRGQVFSALTEPG